MPSAATFKENVVIITGASTGIGEELAYQLAAQGAWLVLSARRTNELQRVAERVRALGGKALVVTCDVAKQADCGTLISTAITHYGRIDTLVLNAGVTMWANFGDVVDPDILNNIMQVNYMGAVYCTHFALPHLKTSRGRIVGIASLAGMVGVPTRTGYAASKHAMRGFFDSLRVELEETGVTVTMIYPGFVATGIRENATGPDGRPVLLDPLNDTQAMSVQACVDATVRAMTARKREEVMTAQAKFGQWLRLIAPKIVDGMARRAVNRTQKNMDEITK